MEVCLILVGYYHICILQYLKYGGTLISYCNYSLQQVEFRVCEITCFYPLPPLLLKAEECCFVHVRPSRAITK